MTFLSEDPFHICLQARSSLSCPKITNNCDLHRFQQLFALTVLATIQFGSRACGTLLKVRMVVVQSLRSNGASQQCFVLGKYKTWTQVYFGFLIALLAIGTLKLLWFKFQEVEFTLNRILIITLCKMGTYKLITYNYCASHFFFQRRFCPMP